VHGLAWLIKEGGVDLRRGLVCEYVEPGHGCSSEGCGIWKGERERTGSQ
jgi:hypothetical protein